MLCDIEQYEVNWKNYYNILHIQLDADNGTIRQAYRKLAHMYHPDLCKAKDAKAQMVLINEAYEILCNTTKRFLYNQALAKRIPKAASRPAPESVTRVPNDDDEITAAEVMEIRQLYVRNIMTIDQLSRKYNISPTDIFYIIRGKTWKNVPSY